MNQQVPPATLLSAADWRERARVHRQRAERHTVPARHRRERSLPHPIADFLFEYYPFSCSLLERWQPGFGTGLEWHAPDLPPGLAARWYVNQDGWLAADPLRLGVAERQRLVWITELLQATMEQPGCLHANMDLLQMGRQGDAVEWFRPAVGVPVPILERMSSSSGLRARRP